jgi:hypothetical protein
MSYPHLYSLSFSLFFSRLVSSRLVSSRLVSPPFLTLHFSPLLPLHSNHTSRECQIANGLGVTVLISSIFVYVAIHQRNAKLSITPHHSRTNSSSAEPIGDSESDEAMRLKKSRDNLVAVTNGDEDDNNPL